MSGPEQAILTSQFLEGSKSGGIIGGRFMEQIHGKEVIRYFADEAAADAVTADAGTQAALRAIGAWSDLNWEEIEPELNRIRRASRPTLPITDL
jgi:hypothetical protein